MLLLSNSAFNFGWTKFVMWHWNKNEEVLHFKTKTAVSWRALKQMQIFFTQPHWNLFFVCQEGKKFVQFKISIEYQPNEKLRKLLKSRPASSCIIPCPQTCLRGGPLGPLSVVAFNFNQVCCLLQNLLKLLKSVRYRSLKYSNYEKLLGNPCSFISNFSTNKRSEIVTVLFIDNWI